MQRSKLVLGLVVALGVGSLGAAAVAMENDTSGAGSLADDPVTTTIAVDPSTTTSTTTSTSAPTTTVAPVTEPAAATGDASGDGGVERSTDGCDGQTYANHGDYVSSVAHDPNRQPGDVAAAAQSDCGKPVTAADGGDDGTSTETPETEAPDDADPGNGNGSGHGNAGGGGRGNSGR